MAFFNVENITKEYSQLFYDWSDDKKCSELENYQDVFDILMEQVKEVKEFKKSGVALDAGQQLLDNTYDIIKDENQEVKKTLFKNIIVDNIVTSTKRVLTHNNCLEVFLSEHKKIGFSEDTSKLVPIIKENNMFPKICLDIYLKSLSKISEKIKQYVFNKIGQLQINRVASNSEQTFTYILIYVDKQTNFKILRPIMINTEEEVSVELFKIFLAFGPPEKLHIYENRKKSFYENVFKRIKVLMPIFDIEWTMETTSSFSAVASHVMEEFINWRNETGCTNWEIGCYIVQWKLNSTKPIQQDKNSMLNRNPYEVVFAKSLNPIVNNKSKHPKKDKTKPPTSFDVAHTSKQANTETLSTETVLPRIDITEKFSSTIEIISDESDNELAS